MSGVLQEYDQFWDFVDEIQKEFPKFDVIEKDDSKIMKLIYVCTLMRFWNRDFMKNYITTFFGKVYMPARLFGTRTGYEVLRHELVHLRDADRYHVLFALTYLFFPLPIIFTGRAFWEYRAYCESMVVASERFGGVPREFINFYVNLFCVSDYLWMFPFRKFMEKRFINFLNSRGIKIL